MKTKHWTKSTHSGKNTFFPMVHGFHVHQMKHEKTSEKKKKKKKKRKKKEEEENLKINKSNLNLFTAYCILPSHSEAYTCYWGP